MEVRNMLTRMTSNNNILAIEKGLQGSDLRSRLIANNIANVNTPGFKRSDVSFTTEISRILSGDNFCGKISSCRHIPIGARELSEFTPEPQLEDEYSYRNDDNNVDMDVEIAQLTKNSLYYQALTKQAQGYFQNLSNVISRAGQQ
ncbi:MAG: flagellar basal body rod protein FlgB [Candidatus Wallbacteria bacterium HGW-Wallbacteria-1]|jgi:flagellar basal-body rod protein FlgB|uniref:Flagellar basal body rod protein FlgB n=1 Tax=Candidatus Wallbacteria bacterium HGW-Wallbacteria-1 TaxID=2013854 RepID=A0A2N1PSS1_9BACT|nr:MAG: flagellar basal body rod protein FlgB [Candidatus Wallbacteria bacterium HGW-Wallbacteria-1]